MRPSGVIRHALWPPVAPPSAAAGIMVRNFHWVKLRLGLHIRGAG